MSDNLSNEKDRLIQFIESSVGDYWKTIDEISAHTKMDHPTILKIISTSGDFVRSSYRTKNGESVFTTRNMFRNKAPFVDKLIGAFKNRID